jgi:hypothetical protein
MTATRRGDDGPSLDAKAKEEILREDARHRHRLVEIESGNPGTMADLLAEENDRHLARLTRIYAELADRRMEQAAPADGGHSAKRSPRRRRPQHGTVW